MGACCSSDAVPPPSHGTRGLEPVDDDTGHPFAPQRQTSSTGAGAGSSSSPTKAAVGANSNARRVSLVARSDAVAAAAKAAAAAGGGAAAAATPSRPPLKFGAYSGSVGVAADRAVSASRSTSVARQPAAAASGTMTPRRGSVTSQQQQSVPSTPSKQSAAERTASAARDHAARLAQSRAGVAAQSPTAVVATPRRLSTTIGPTRGGGAPALSPTNSVSAPSRSPASPAAAAPTPAPHGVNVAVGLGDTDTLAPAAAGALGRKAVVFQRGVASPISGAPAGGGGARHARPLLLQRTPSHADSSRQASLRSWGSRPRNSSSSQTGGALRTTSHAPPPPPPEAYLKPRRAAPAAYPPPFTTPRAVDRAPTPASVPRADASATRELPRRVLAEDLLNPRERAEWVRAAQQSRLQPPGAARALASRPSSRNNSVTSRGRSASAGCLAVTASASAAPPPQQHRPPAAALIEVSRAGVNAIAHRVAEILVAGLGGTAASAAAAPAHERHPQPRWNQPPQREDVRGHAASSPVPRHPADVASVAAPPAAARAVSVRGEEPPRGAGGSLIQQPAGVNTSPARVAPLPEPPLADGAAQVNRRTSPQRRLAAQLAVGGAPPGAGGRTQAQPQTHTQPRMWQPRKDAAPPTLWLTQPRDESAFATQHHLQSHH